MACTWLLGYRLHSYSGLQWFRWFWAKRRGRYAVRRNSHLNVSPLSGTTLAHSYNKGKLWAKKSNFHVFSKKLGILMRPKTVMGKMMTNFGTLEDVQTWLDLTTLCQAATVHCRTKKRVFRLAKNTTGLPIGFYLKSHPETRAEILPAGSLRALAASSVPAPLQRAPSAPPSQHLPSEAAQGPTGTEMMKLGALLARVSLQARKDPKALRSTCFRNHLGQTIKQLQSNTPLIPQPSCSNLSTCGFCSIFVFCLIDSIGKDCPWVPWLKEFTGSPSLLVGAPLLLSPTEPKKWPKATTLRLEDSAARSNC